MSFGLICSSAILPIPMLNLFFLFFSSFRSDFCSFMFMFCILKNSSWISISISSIVSLFFTTKVSFSLNRFSIYIIYFISLSYLFYSVFYLFWSYVFQPQSGIFWVLSFCVYWLPDFRFDLFKPETCVAETCVRLEKLFLKHL